MKIQEYLAKGILSSHGISVPSSVFYSGQPEKESPFLPCVLKSQVLVGSRMKNGGVLFAANNSEFREALSELLVKPIRGVEPEGVLVEEKSEIEKEYYCSIFINRVERDVYVSFSEQGGINIEENADSVKTGLFEEMISWLKIQYSVEFAEIVRKMRKIMEDEDATYVEINPIALTTDGKLVALDCVMDLDENAYFRNEKYPNYMDLSELNAPFHYVRLDGDIGIIGCGAGIVMATMDAITMKGGKPADFLDIGGGAKKAITIEALSTLYEEGIRRIVMNIFGGITSCDEIAKAVLEFRKMKGDVNIFLRIAGNNAEIAKEILKEAGMATYEHMYEMVDACMEAVSVHA